MTDREFEKTIMSEKRIVYIAFWDVDEDSIEHGENDVVIKMRTLNLGEYIKTAMRMQPDEVRIIMN